MSLTPEQKTVVPHKRHSGMFILRGHADTLATAFTTAAADSSTTSSSPQQEQQTFFMPIESGRFINNNTEGQQQEQGQQQGESETTTTNILMQVRRWNPFQSPIAAAILGGLDFIPGLKTSSSSSSNSNTNNNILYIGNHFNSSAVHLADILHHHHQNNNDNVSCTASQLISVIFSGNSESIQTKTIQEMNDWKIKLDSGAEKDEDYPQTGVTIEVDEDGVKELFESNCLPIEAKEPIFLHNNTSGCGDPSAVDFQNTVELGKRIRELVSNQLANPDQDKFDAVFVEITNDSRFAFHSNNNFENFVKDLISPVSDAFLKDFDGVGDGTNGGGGGGLFVLVDATSSRNQENNKNSACEVFASVVDQLRSTGGFKPREQITLAPFFRNDCAVIVSAKK